MSLSETSVDSFCSLLRDSKVTAVSFDIFDTVVTRIFAHPTDLFSELGVQLVAQKIVTVSPARFGRLRVFAERQARTLREDTEPNLDEIYAALGTKLGWSAADTETAKQAELALEIASLRPNPRLVALVEVARTHGCAIAFVSDMYLPSTLLRRLLEGHRIAQPGDPILVSNEYRTTKARGGLFAEVEKTLQRSPREILHVGDNPRGDEAVPRSLGFRTLLIRDTQLGPLENVHLLFSAELEGIPGRFAAASRNARVARAAEASDQALFEIGAGILGPILVNFAVWTLVRAQQRGLKRLYYVSRDGQVMRAIAQAVQARLPHFREIDCRYIYGSRIAWHHAALGTLDRRHLRWLLDRQPNINAATFARRVGVDTELIEQILRESNTAFLADKSDWDEYDLNLARPILQMQDQRILAAAGAENRRIVAQNYFQQEGLLDGTPWGLVELGWSGSMLTSLCHALERKDRLDAFYLCHTHDDPDLPVEVALQSFLIRPCGAQQYFGRHLRLAEMIEALTAADHPTVLGYRQDTDRVGPILKSGTAPIWSADDLNSLRRGAHAFTEALDPDTLNRLCERLAAEPTSHLLAIELLSALSCFAEKPTREHATPFTRCVFSEDPADEHRRTFARVVPFWKALVSPAFAENDLWSQGSLACTPGITQALIKGGLIYALEHGWTQFRRKLS